jgi:hypothetical protein
MLYKIHRIFLDFFHRPVFQKTLCFGNWICFRPQVKVGEKTPTQLGPLERANLNHCQSLFSPPLSPEDGNRSRSRNVVFFEIQDDGKSPEKIWYEMVSFMERMGVRYVLGVCVVC